MSRHLHIVCLDAPYPADCGDSIDTFEKIRGLHASGIRILLHLIKHDADIDPELTNYCDAVKCYSVDKRSANIDGLIASINENDFPVLLEDIYVPDLLIPINTGKRKIVIRARTGDFYKRKLKNEKSWLSSFIASDRQKNLFPSPNYFYACISEQLTTTLRQQNSLNEAEFLPPLVAWQEVKSGIGMGNFCLYHGNLSDPANEKTAFWLLEKIFSEIRFPFVVAGKNPSRRISKLAHLYSHTCIVPNPSQKEIDDLIQKAHINIVPSFQPGKVYKLLHSLYEGRHCLTNEMAVQNTNLSQVCHIANDCKDKIEAIKYLITKPFTRDEIELRKNLLLEQYDNRKSIGQLLDWLY